MALERYSEGARFTTKEVDLIRRAQNLIDEVAFANRHLPYGGLAKAIVDLTRVLLASVDDPKVIEYDSVMTLLSNVHDDFMGNHSQDAMASTGGPDRPDRTDKPLDDDDGCP